MLIVYHNHKLLVEVIRDGFAVTLPGHQDIISGIHAIAKAYPDELLVWCAQEIRSILNVEQLEAIFHHDAVMTSYFTSNSDQMHSSIGYVDPTPFVKVNKNVLYPSWFMNADVGGVNTRIIINFSKDNCKTNDFEFYLNLMARKAMWQGVSCFSDPRLLKKSYSKKKNTSKGKYTDVFRFVRFHYKAQWLFFLFLIIAYYDKRLPVLAFFRGLFFSKSNAHVNCMEGVQVLSKKEFSKTNAVDVLIPTIGRKQFLYDFLKDLRNQTFLPAKVIIVEQNPDPKSVSELDYLEKETWPFTVKHFFTHQAGACNARNMALKEVSGDWVFFADDDIRIESDFLAEGLQSLKKYGERAATFFCYKEGETPNFTYPLQWGTFGSGCSIVKSESLQGIFFDHKFEFGFGEDGDFGMQLRNKGTDVFYFAKPDIFHLKAPIGGFRTKPVLAWAEEKIQPKPSPTVMLYRLKNLTLEQQRSEKVKLYMNFYKHQPIKNPLRYLIVMSRKWEVSKKWALKLMNND